MRAEVKLHRLFLWILTALLLAVVALFTYLVSVPDAIWGQVVGSLLIATIVSTVLLYIGGLEELMAVYFGLEHRRECLGYFALGLLSIGTGLFLALASDASLATIALVVSPHAILLSVAEFRMAVHLQHHPKLRRALRVFSACELLLGVALLMSWKRSNEDIVALLGFGAAITVLQLIGLLWYKHQPMAKLA